MSVRNTLFLRDVFILAVTAFGGPHAHISMFLETLVRRRNYLSEEELMELLALCQFLPGPTSTQTLIAIGYKRGGPFLAFLTTLIWTFPAMIIMGSVVFMFGLFYKKGISTDFLIFIKPMAVGFVAVAGYRLSKSLRRTSPIALILIAVTIVTVLIRSPWVPPLALLLGGIASNLAYKFFGTKSQKLESSPSVSLWQSMKKIQWHYLTIFFIILGSAVILGAITKYKPLLLFENTYRFGSMIFGGGYVLIPMMYEQFVIHRSYLTSNDFLSGFGIVQAIPGPVFSFSTFTGGMALNDLGTTGRIAGSLIGTVGIFLPGVLFVFFVYPFWEEFKKMKIIQRSLDGILAASAGLIVAAALVFIESLGLNLPNITVFCITFLLLIFSRIPAPFIVLIALGAGFLP